MKLPVLCMPNKLRRFHLYSKTSKYTTGSALYQMQNGKHKLIAYVSKDFLKQQRVIPSQSWNCVDWLLT